MTHPHSPSPASPCCLLPLPLSARRQPAHSVSHARAPWHMQPLLLLPDVANLCSCACPRNRIFPVSLDKGSHSQDQPLPFRSKESPRLLLYSVSLSGSLLFVHP